MNRFLGAVAVTLMVLAGCSANDSTPDTLPSAETDPNTDAATSNNNPGSDGQSEPGAEATVYALAAVNAAPEGAFAVEIMPDAPAPSATEVGVLTNGSGRTVGTDGVALVSYIAVGWDGAIAHHSSDVDDRLSVVIGKPADAPPDAVSLPGAIEQALVDSSVGTRLMIALPAGTPGMPAALPQGTAHVVVLDILAFQTPEAS